MNENIDIRKLVCPKEAHHRERRMDFCYSNLFHSFVLYIWFCFIFGCGAKQRRTRRKIYVKWGKRMTRYYSYGCLVTSGGSLYISIVYTRLSSTKLRSFFFLWLFIFLTNNDRFVAVYKVKVDMRAALLHDRMVLSRLPACFNASYWNDHLRLRPMHTHTARDMQSNNKQVNDHYHHLWLYHDNNIKTEKKYTKKWARKRWTAHDTRKIDHKHKNKQFCPMIYQRK